MIKYVITGAKRNTGEPISIMIDAASAKEAEGYANDLGILGGDDRVATTLRDRLARLLPQTEDHCNG